jgi:two-component system chemotaxis response regulator CheB
MKIDDRDIQLIVIGTSAGGVDAMTTLLRYLQTPLPVPMLVTLHVSPHSRWLEGVFVPASPNIAVKEAEDKEMLQPGNVYFAPADYHLLVERRGSVSLSSEEPVSFSRPSIDVMFESAALARGAETLGILLTGANRDGASGLRAIAAAGGLTWVQDPHEARYPAMPLAALALGRPTRVLSVAQMGELLSRQPN